MFLTHKTKRNMQTPRRRQAACKGRVSEARWMVVEHQTSVAKAAAERHLLLDGYQTGDLW